MRSQVTGKSPLWVVTKFVLGW